MKLVRREPFEKDLSRTVKQFSKSQRSINTIIDSLVKNPIQGDRIPGFKGVLLYKIRIPLKEYNIGKRGGLRLIYMVDMSNKWVLPVTIYCKNDHRDEGDIIKLTKNSLKAILSS